MKKPKNKLPQNNSTDKKCQFCAGKKLVYCLPNGGIEVNKGYKEAVEQMLNKLGEKLEKKSCPNCTKKVEKITKNKTIKDVKSIRGGKKDSKKNHS